MQGRIRQNAHVKMLPGFSCLSRVLEKPANNFFSGVSDAFWKNLV
jgi:hypothetical protein